MALCLAACGDNANDSPPRESKTTADSEAKPKPTPPPSNAAQLDELLKVRAQALESGQVEAFLKTSTGAQATRDRRAIAAAEDLPIETVRLTAPATEIEGDRATLRANMLYTFDRVDTTFVKTSRMTAVKTPEGWRISNDRPSAGVLAPWEYARYRARTSKNFLALAPRNLKVGSLMRDLEKGRARMRRGLPGVKVPRRVLVIVARNGNDTRALTTNLKTLRSLVAVAEAKFSVTGSAKRISRLEGERVFVLWRSYGSRSATERQKVVAHELVHVALANRTSARTPPWLYEGIALYASGDNRSGDAGALISGRGVLRDASKQSAAKAAMSLNRLSNVKALDNMSSVSLAFAYAYSSAAAYTIAAKHGRNALLRLITAYNSEKNRGSGRKLADRVVRRTLHKSLKTLESEIDAYAASNSRF